MPGKRVVKSFVGGVVSDKFITELIQSMMQSISRNFLADRAVQEGIAGKERQSGDWASRAA